MYVCTYGGGGGANGIVLFRLYKLNEKISAIFEGTSDSLDYLNGYHHLFHSSPNPIDYPKRLHLDRRPSCQHCAFYGHILFSKSPGSRGERCLIITIAYILHCIFGGFDSRLRALSGISY